MNPEEYERMYRLEDRHWWYAGMRAIVDGLLTAGHLPSGQWRLLDAGCGTGANLIHLNPWGQTVGADFSELALSFCRRRDHRRLVQASVEHLPFTEASFDLVTSFDVLYHRGVSSDVAALREFWRVLRPGGLLLLRLPAYEFLRSHHDEAVHTRERYTAAKLRRRLAEAGFAVIKTSYANTLLFPLAAAKRLGERVFPRLGSGSELTMPRPWVNGLLRALLQVEAQLLRRTSLPFGLSLFCLAGKPAIPPP